MMDTLEQFAFESDKQVEQISIKTKIVSSDGLPIDEERGVGSDAMYRLRQSQELIRLYAENAINAFKNFGAAEVQEVTLKFGIKMGGKAGIPYVTEGSAESNLEVQVKCTFPKNPSTVQQNSPQGFD